MHTLLLQTRAGAQVSVTPWDGLERRQAKTCSAPPNGQEERSVSNIYVLLGNLAIQKDWRSKSLVNLYKKAMCGDSFIWAACLRDGEDHFRPTHGCRVGCVDVKHIVH